MTISEPSPNYVSGYSTAAFQRLSAQCLHTRLISPTYPPKTGSYRSDSYLDYSLECTVELPTKASLVYPSDAVNANVQISIKDQQTRSIYKSLHYGNYITTVVLMQL